MRYKIQENHLNCKASEIFYKLVPWTTAETLAFLHLMRLGYFSGVRWDVLSKARKKSLAYFSLKTSGYGENDRKNGGILSLRLTPELLLLFAYALMAFSSAELKKFKLMHFTLQLNFIKYKGNYSNSSSGG